MVISLMGSWGSGKSSIKNMALEQLVLTKGCQVIEFNPWQWADQDKLSSAFFEEVSRIVQRKDPTKADKALAKALRSYSQYLNSGAGVLSAAAKCTPILLSSALVTTALGSLAEGTAAQVTVWTVSGIGWIGALTPWMKKGANWAAKCSKSLDKQAKDNERSLGQIRDELQTLLTGRTQPLLIVLDDLDRLSNEQMKAIFQLVKAHMDFANVVFLLLFQRDTVEQGLQKAGFDSADYLEKIIQAPFNVPVISSGQMEKVLFNRLNTILVDEPQLQRRFDKEYWDRMFQVGIRPFFRKLRHVYRYSSTLAFHCRLLRGTEVAEVSAVDLFALECLRVFAPQTYEELPRHKALLTGSEPFAREDEGQRVRVVQLFDQLVTLAPTNHQTSTRQLLREMFPTLDWVFTNTRYDQQIQFRWLINSRVCCGDVFDRYFELAVPEQDVPNSLLHELSRRITDPGGFTTLLSAHDDERQAEILQRLLGLVEEFPLDQASAVVKTLLHAGEGVGRQMSFTNFSPRQQVTRLLRLYLARQADDAARSLLVIQAFAAGAGLVVVAQLLAGECALRRRGDVGYFEDEGLGQLKHVYVQTLRQVADHDPDAFLESEDHASYLFDLNNYAEGGGEGRQWVETHVTSPSRFLQFARGQINVRPSCSGGSKARVDYISPTRLEQLLELERCAEWLNRFDSIALSDRESHTLALVKDAVDRHARGERDAWTVE